MFYSIKVSSKNKKLLEAFNKFMLKLRTTSNILTSFSKQNMHKFVTILKSPHVNKTAQEQFEYRFYSKEFTINSFKPLTFFFILKKVNKSSLPGINLKVKSLLKKSGKKQLTALSPDSINLNVVKNYILNQRKLNDQSFKKTKRYIQFFDCYGEIVLKYDFYFN